MARSSVRSLCGGEMNSLEDRRRTFDEVAELYDRFRPGYPEQLFADVIALSGIPEQGRVLEIGCGTGQATVKLAEHGYRMTCLEPGSNLARLAADKLARFPNVRVEICTFEDWPSTESSLDLVMAAQSFHFLDPVSALLKAASALRLGGAIAVFGHRPLRGGSEVHHRVQDAYARHAPDLGRGEDGPPLEDRIDETGLFESVVMTRYRWQGVYTAAEYVGLMETQSHHRLLAPEQRAALLGAIGDTIDGLGGSITIDNVTSLHLARRKTSV